MDSCLSRSEMDFTSLADISVIDGHVHFSHPERLNDILEVMRIARYAKINLVSIPDPMWINHNAALLAFKASQPDRTYTCGAIDYHQAIDGRRLDQKNLFDQIVELKTLGFDGLKLIEGKPTMRRSIPIALDSPAYEGMWEALDYFNYPIVWHVADPEEFWDEVRCPGWARLQSWCYAHGSYPSKEQLYEEVEHVLGRHPGLRIIFAHFYFLSADLERAGKFLDAHPNVCFDLTPGIEMYHNFTRRPCDARAFFLRYQDQLIYGTDISTDSFEQSAHGMASSLGLTWLVRNFLEQDETFPIPRWMEYWLPWDLDRFLPLALPQSVLEKIYHVNFERIFGAQPSSLDLAMAIDEVERLARVIETNRAYKSKLNPASVAVALLRKLNERIRNSQCRTNES